MNVAVSWPKLTSADWDAADRTQHPIRDTGIKWTKLDKDCPGGAHILAPPHYINADEDEFERFAFLTKTGVDRFNQARLDLDNQVRSTTAVLPEYGIQRTSHLAGFPAGLSPTPESGRSS